VYTQTDAENIALERTVSQRASVLLNTDTNSCSGNVNTVYGVGDMQLQYSVNSNTSATGDSSNWRKNFYDTFGLSVTHVGMYLVTVHVRTALYSAIYFCVHHVLKW
jgi:hypothetical protein